MISSDPTEECVLVTAVCRLPVVFAVFGVALGSFSDGKTLCSEQTHEQLTGKYYIRNSKIPYS